ncbi:MAG: hypothetical protein KJ060_11075, partial [Candidatus Hydrogenedentes bacterium]|nr:hypothetical protein [Candidatus Hydrogenedentota bacterium]
MRQNPDLASMRHGFLRSLTFLIIVFLIPSVEAVSTEPNTLDNGAIRVEVDPALFSVRFVGVPGGANFVAPLPVDETVRESEDWVDPGGLQTDVLPYTARDAASRRGPAEIVEQREDYIALLGPPSEHTGMRIKKEIQLLGREPKARFRVTAMRVAGESGDTAIRNTVRLSKGTTIRLLRDEGDVRVLAGADAITPAVVKSRKYWLIPVPPTSPMDGVILGAFVPTLI